MRTEIKLDTGSYIKVDTVTYHVPYLQACIGSGLNRTATQIECCLDLECLDDGSPLHLYISDLCFAEELYEKLGEFIQSAKAKGRGWRSDLRLGERGTLESHALLVGRIK